MEAQKAREPRRLQHPTTRAGRLPSTTLSDALLEHPRRIATCVPNQRSTLAYLEHIKYVGVVSRCRIRAFVVIMQNSKAQDVANGPIDSWATGNVGRRTCLLMSPCSANSMTMYRLSFSTKASQYLQRMRYSNRAAMQRLRNTAQREAASCRCKLARDARLPPDLSGTLPADVLVLDRR